MIKETTLGVSHRFLLALLVTLLVVSQSDAEDDGVGLMASLRNHYASIAREITLRSAGDSGERFVMMEKPAMSWASLGGWSGDLFVWTGNGKIQAVGCIGAQQTSEEQFRDFYEFHSLAAEPLEDVLLTPKIRWIPTDDAANRARLVGAPLPATSPSLRLSQMRRLARSFHVGMQVNDDNVENELRLLPQPVARECRELDDRAEKVETSATTIDSALFAFVSSSGTDPEAFLLLEAVRQEQQTVWMFCVVRFTTRELWINRDNAATKTIDKVTDQAMQGWASGLIKDAYFFTWNSTFSRSELLQD
ncbi:hypothetical protein [Rhodopirellula sp. MGV]|uniref:hypothetical protein n=1 Tax=Rhodopirellula sp. MGV TaxID=2023130 RepID=UPI000B9708FA|nr:hypothetical protein [Rhodopirellula sp. MGV]OYP29942.1 hypothetical protein CGZ80_23240 [Rhodopirellula sp. MGV]PNY37583.1 hypothetical protein C2E31_07080 [Rhodopirellula baltica]